jgi:short-subunit dehydrogenase
MERRVALVTGASAGIGTAFCRALAARDENLVIVARNELRLKELAGALAAEHGIEVEALPADLGTDPGVARVEARLRDAARPVDLLINNAGILTTGAFHEMPVDQELAEIRLNVVALVRLTHAALGPMVERGHGGIINVSSVAAYQATPMSATYSATKSFVSSFTNAIHEELHDTGVKAMVLAPGFTHTEIHDRADIDNVDLPKFAWQMPDEVVAAALKAYDKGRAVCIPGAVNTVAAAFSATMPAGLTRKVAKRVMRRAF